ncbi:LOW QUALITY PROTEIN: uncharacterized mitochondrial protein AtMg00370-like [Eucalyptus grandis]|uniref:LOW QUALITY PROTEIN: uncharacterized mitochondrial protein AtMg00370-like n=1 Tax=Eucalyptus grandis TaxID=71139 RepID=UPI00192E9316|nr:LOW QUALITY PROTEIN: uncharacterized mitochondrial protein AtMg00370-like [Eucalyptus grandis]
MILKSFLLGNPVSLCMNIINSIVMVGLYYGFLTTFSIGPSYLFLLRARVLEEGEEGTEKKVSATTSFIAGQLMMFISIYYAPLHLALGRPHTITVLALPYLLFHFFWNNHKHFFDYGSTTRNSMRNLSIQCVFLNNLIFQLFNHFILPSSMLARLVNIYIFRCNNKIHNALLMVPTMLVFLAGVTKNAQRLRALNLSGFPRLRESMLSSLHGLRKPILLHHKSSPGAIIKLVEELDVLGTGYSNEEEAKLSESTVVKHAYHKVFAVDALRVIQLNSISFMRHWRRNCRKYLTSLKVKPKDQPYEEFGNKQDAKAK